MQTPDAVLAAELQLSGDAETQTLKGYLSYVAQNFGLPAMAAEFTICELSERNSSGLLMKRSAKEWIFGYEDPFLNKINGYPSNISAIHSIRDIDTLDIDHVPWGQNTDTMFSAGATKYVLKTGLGISKGNATTILRRTDGDLSDRIVCTDTNHVEIVSGKLITTAQ